MRINGIDLAPFSRRQRRLLVLLGLNTPRLMTIGELVACAYPDPDEEPNYATTYVRSSIRDIRAKLRGWTITSVWGRGYILERLNG